MPLPFDESRFIEALTSHQPALEAFCHAHLARREDAKEVLQATCVKLWQKAREWNPETNFLPWAFTVARFTVLSHLRDRMRDRLVFDEDVLLKMSSDIDAAAGAFTERQEALDVCMEKLDREEQALLSEHYIAGRSLAELAGASQRSQSAIKMNLLRLRQRLSACIERQMKPA